MTQYFNEARGPALEGPGTRLLLRPLYRAVEGATVSAETQEHDCGRFQFRTKDGLEGTMRAQYLYRVKGPAGARNFYWEYGGDASRIDVIVKGELMKQIAKVRGADVTTGYYQVGDDKIDYLIAAEVEARKRLEDEKAGIEVTNFAITETNFTGDAEAILQQEARALEEAKARRIRADIQVYESQQKALATMLTAKGYLESAQVYRGSRGTKSNLKIGDIALLLADMDNNQEVAEQGGRIIKIT